MSPMEATDPLAAVDMFFNLSPICNQSQLHPSYVLVHTWAQHVINNGLQERLPVIEPGKHKNFFSHGVRKDEFDVFHTWLESVHKTISTSEKSVVFLLRVLPNIVT